MNILLMSLIFLIACSKDISPMEYGKDQCDHCRMTLTDRKYGAEIITKKGKTIKFDAAECMLNYLKEKKTDGTEIEKYLVINLTDPGVLIDAAKASYLISLELRSPMGENISSFADKDSADKYQNDFGGNVYSWDELKKKFN
ncbi:MAG TPA: nitrous oxide reductase accessory protein NosL [Ignavibacteria bacterium]|nr:nitrous oxide reductase accessory protein NosL [Ignavibacteria bacterium]